MAQARHFRKEDEKIHLHSDKNTDLEEFFLVLSLYQQECLKRRKYVLLCMSKSMLPKGRDKVQDPVPKSEIFESKKNWSGAK